MADFYVDGNASDTGDGSLASPWNRLEQIELYDTNTGFAPGDRILFKRGTFVTSQNAKYVAVNGGTADSPIIFGTYYNDDGSDDETQLKPVIDCGNMNASDSWVEQSSQGLAGVWLGDYTGTVVNGLWEDLVWLPHAPSMDSITAGTWFWNHDSNPEYARDPAYADGIYYMPSDGADPSTHSLKRGNAKLSISYSDLQYVEYHNLDLRGGWTCLFMANGASSAENLYGLKSINCEYSESVEPLTFHFRNGFSVYENRAIGNIIHDTGHGITQQSNSAGPEPLVGAVNRDNVVYNINTDGKFNTYKINNILDQEAFELQNPVNCIVERNIIYDIGAVGTNYGTGVIWWPHPTGGAMDNNRINTNVLRRIHYSALILGAGVDAPNTGGNQAACNLIEETDSFGVRINTTSQNSYFANNTMVDCDTGIYAQAGCGEWQAVNNIVVSSGKTNTDFGSGSTVSADNNLYSGLNVFMHGGVSYDFGGWQAQTGNDGNSLFEDPLFVDPENGDYNLQKNSPCVGKGVKWWGNGPRPESLSGEPLPDADIDLGAYQSTWSPNHPVNL
ncbi:MAG TPA: hypothetical protein ENJ65_02125 [Candidatus Tenderia electrophaga]|uniref:Right handed beta helix domain-containing protein n=1 Tax=Candidatus Tenderia electrophaga TaxID=1748243 RepID=A0A832J5V1_9GAMM|nr:hypothetical protein [Candidatus Tenderia electrophaga]